MSTTQDDAVSYFTQGFNCAQAVLLAHGPRLGIEADHCLRLAAPFGAGMARTGSTCGAVTGALMVVGLRLGHTVADDLATKDRCYEVSRDFLGRFRERHGTLLCKELLGCDPGTPEGLAEVKARNLHTTICTALVRTAVELLGDVLQEAGK
jgi:C_GCAxxG_C_C family probable redox protein